MLSELLENEVLTVAFYGEETDWNSRGVYLDAYNMHHISKRCAAQA